MNGAREKEVFCEAMDIEDPSEREAFIRRSCADDSVLFEAVTQLFAAIDDDDDWLEPSDFQHLDEERTSLGSALAEERRFLDLLDSRGQRQIGNHLLFEEIGRGAMGVVFRARQLGLDREVALKIVLHAALASEGERQRFRLEAQAAARLKHPHIVPIHEVGSHGDHDYYTMALIGGGTLGDRMKQGRTPPREAVPVFLKILGAVGEAHEHGVVHRDLKPDNILLTRDGEPMVSDFGLACWLDRESELTLTGQLMGTPRYMAPELAAGTGRASTRSDLYALGAILYEWVVGEPVFDGGSVVTTLRMIQETPVPSPRIRFPEIDRDLETIILKCLEKQADRRYASAAALAADLTAWLEHRPISARPPGPVERLGKWIRRNPVHATLAGAGLVFLLFIGIAGPLTAWRQNRLRIEAETARADAESAATEALRQAEVNRRLAYSANQRFIQLSHELQGDSSLASETMITGWVPAGDEGDLRGWEWYFNFGRIHRDEKTFRIPGTVTSLSFAPDGETVAASGPQGTEIRNTLSGALVRKLAGSDGHRKNIWSPDGKHILTATKEGLLRLWNPANGGNRPLAVEVSGIADVDWKGETLLTLDSAGIRCWRFNDKGEPALLGSIPASEPPWQRIALNGDGTRFAAAGSSRVLFVWNVASLDEPLLQLDGAASELASLAWKPDGRWLAASTKQGAVRIWEIPGGQRVARIAYKGDAPIHDFAWNPAGDQLAVIEPLGRQSEVFDLVASKGKPLRGFTESESPQVIAWSPESHTIAIGSQSGLVVLARHGLPAAERDFFKHSGPVASLHWTPDGGFLSCLAGDNQMFRIDTVTAKVSEPLRVGRPDPRSPIAWNPDSGALAIARGDRVEIVGRRADFKTPPIRVAMPEVASIVWLNARDFLTCGTMGEVEAVRRNRNTGEPMFARPQAGSDPDYHAFSTSPDGRHLLGTGTGQRLTLWNLADGRILLDHAPPNGKGQETCHAWDPDGNRFATANAGGDLSFWKPGATEPIRRLPAHRGPVLALAWHPRGARLASAGRDGLIRIWDPETGEMLLDLKGHTGPVRDLEWGPDGRRLASCGADGTVRIWDASAGYLLSAE